MAKNLPEPRVTNAEITFIQNQQMKVSTNLADVGCFEEIFTICSFKTFHDARKINKLFRT